MHKTWKLAEWERYLMSNGFSLTRDNGGHKVYKRGPDEVIAVARHNPNRMSCARIIKEYHLEERTTNK